jgi:P-type Mg2+ transporter
VWTGGGRRQLQRDAADARPLGSRSRRSGAVVGYLADGINDAPPLHLADVGISVDKGTYVARAAADIVLLQPSLSTIAQGVREGRRTSANTLKYIRMGISSNFGNMLSMAGAAVFLPFLPMLPSQILLNNLICDASQTDIPSDNVDPETRGEPARWEPRGHRGVHACIRPDQLDLRPPHFRVPARRAPCRRERVPYWRFVESLATQVLVIFALRTRRRPFWRSRPSRLLVAAALGAATLAILLPISLLATWLGFSALPLPFWAALATFVVAYLAIVEIVKRRLWQRVVPSR